MKRLTLILLLPFALAACKRSVRDSGCISRYDGPVYNYPPLSTGQLDTIKSLFSANGLSLDNLQFVYYYSDTLKDTANAPYFNQVVSASAIINGLPVFASGYAWSFRNGVWVRYPGANPTWDYPGSDTTGHQTLPALRSAFFKTFESTVYGNGPNISTQRLGRPGTYYRDSCLYAQLGYVDASTRPDNNGSIPYGKKLLKVWRVFLQTIGPVPYYTRTPITSVFVEDSTGKAWAQFLAVPGLLYY